MSYTDRFRTDASATSATPRRRGGRNEMTVGRLEDMINRACQPSMVEPNLALNLDISEAINDKRANSPRHAAVEIVKLINSRVPQSAILALGLLDICVKNCGYPFHLQVSRKEFLNEMVRKFPERPPMQYSRVMMLVLEQIQFWKETLCKTNKNRQDFAYIRDMHRLLEYKGYMFPELNMEDAYVLNENENQVRTAAEIEQEERDAQSAKLQELIRRGTPRDLQEANRLMGIMTGYKKDEADEDANYRAKAAKDLDRLKRKADLLDEMLRNVPQGRGLSATGGEDDVYLEIVSALRSAQPKITQMINDNEESDEEATVRLLGLNDYIHSLLSKYDLIKGGHVDQAAEVQIVSPPGTTSTASGQDTSRQTVMESLIDIDDDDTLPSQPSPQAPTTSSSTQSSHTTENLIDALDGLSVGNIALSAGSTGSTPQPSMSTSQTLESSISNSPAASASEWDVFTSATTSQPRVATPEQATRRVNVSSSTLKIDFDVTVRSDKVEINAVYTNSSPLQKITNLDIQLACTKQYKMELKPLSGNSIDPSASITQSMYITPSKPGLKMRWKVSYSVGYGGARIEEDGVAADII